jgi:hypothetical protein
MLWAERSEKTRLASLLDADPDIKSGSDLPLPELSPLLGYPEARSWRSAWPRIALYYECLAFPEPGIF